MRELHRATVDRSLSAVAVAETLQGLPGAFWLDSTLTGGRSIFGAFPSEAVVGWDPEPGLRREPGPQSASWVPRWIGIVPYEACREVELGQGATDPDTRRRANFDAVEWRRYGAVLSVVGTRVEAIGDDPSEVRRLIAALERPRRSLLAEFSPLVAAHPDEMHADSIRRILDQIAAGSVYQVNLARAFHGKAMGSAFAIYAHRFARACVPFGFALEWTEARRVVGASPELCLECLADGTVLTRPIKGTRPRGRTKEEDDALARELASDPKERAELTMVVDLERNDLARISNLGSVEVVSAGDIESFETVHHRVATVRARISDHVGREEVLRAFLPSGSVTGAPKRAAMRLISCLEPERRGLYTGAVGYVAQDGGFRLAMAIRTLTVDHDGQATYFSGGGIVADSVAECEVQETKWKAAQVLRSGKRFNDAPSPEALPPLRPMGPMSAQNWADWHGSITKTLNAPIAPRADMTG
ncbi:MAG: anthranilate synthase component I family protein [Polyangiaceae bacterium]